MRTLSGEHLILKYLIISLILGVVEGVVTYYFLAHSSSHALAAGAFNDPLALFPYILLMLVLALVVLTLSIQGEGINAAQLIMFLAIWLLIGLGAHYLLG
jgi:hypothetical protein